MKRLLAIILCASAFAAEYTPPAANLPGGAYWQRANVGVIGGIPARPTIFTTLSPIGPFSGPLLRDTVYPDASPDSRVIGQFADLVHQAAVFTAATGSYTTSTIRVPLATVGTPNGNISIRLRATSAGVPAAVIASSSNSIAANSFGSSTLAVFNITASIVNGTSYAIDVFTSGAVDASNYVVWQAGPSYAGSNYHSTTGATWVANPGSQLKFKVYDNSSTPQTGDDAPVIQAALDTCPSGQVVRLNTGTYNCLSTLSMRSNITLRGATGTATDVILTFPSVSGYAFVFFNGGGPYDPTIIKTWSAGYTQGTTVITVNNTTSLAIGMVIVLDQLNGTGVFGTGDTGRENDRAQSQAVKIAGISGSDLTISPGIYATTFSGSLTPQIYTWGTSQIENAGLEDLKIDGATSTAFYNVAIEYAYNCWLSNVHTTNSGTSAVATFRCKNLEFRESRFATGRSPGVGSYGVQTNCTSDALIENCIFTGITSPIMPRRGGAGNVASYNYCTNMDNGLPAWMAICFSANHGGHPMFTLGEGNVITSFYGDFIHGSSANIAAYRNRIVGAEGVKTDNTIPVVAAAYNRSYLIVGNVLGKTGYHTVYQDASGSGGAPLCIYRVGYVLDNSDDMTGYDAVALSSMIRKGNYNTVDGGIPASETLSGDTLRDSWYLTSKPTWFGALDWPVPFTAGTALAEAVKIPAGWREIYGNSNYLDTVATPVFSPVAGTYGTAQSVTITCDTSGSTIHFTVNGTTPTSGSATYSSPVAIATTTTLKAIAIKSGLSDSAIASGVYTITTSGGGDATVTGTTSVTGTLTVP